MNTVYSTPAPPSNFHSEGHVRAKCTLHTNNTMHFPGSSDSNTIVEILQWCETALTSKNLRGVSKREVGGNVSASHFLVGNGNMESQPYSGLTCTGEVAASPKAADFLVF